MKSSFLFALGAIAFAWSAPITLGAPAAEVAVEKALAQAKADHKNVFLSFSTPTCSWCKILDKFVHSEDIQPIMDKYFVNLHLTLGETTECNAGAERYAKKYGANGQGVPFHAFLDSKGILIVDSRQNQTGANIGYPYQPEEIDWFMTMLKKAAPKIAEHELSKVEGKLREYAAKKQSS